MEGVKIEGAWPGQEMCVTLHEPINGLAKEPKNRIAIGSYGGPHSFFFAMYADHARKMAAALLAMADEADKRDGVAQ